MLPNYMIHKPCSLSSTNERFHELCQAVANAAQLHDSQTMFAIINKFTPRRPLARAQIRTPSGEIADQHMAHALTVDFVSKMWKGPEKLDNFPHIAPGVPFTVDELEAAIIQSPPNKSVAPPFLPTIIWQSAPRAIAQFLHALLTQWWHQAPPYVPDEWRNAWLFFLPKPGKPNSHPEHMRPIALMEPLGKIVLGLVASKLKQQLGFVLCRAPHFGFLPLRSALDAITRVAKHCRLVRTLTGSQRRTVSQQMANTRAFVFCGGLQLFLDLNRAFDSTCRHLLMSHLTDMQTSPELLAIIGAWHDQTSYNIIHSEGTSQVKIGKGLRQGCKLAPTLWVTFMDKFLKLLAERTGWQWISQNVTIYADDIHIGCCFHNTTEFQRALRNMGHVLDVIESMHLQLSYDKSFFILATAGTNTRPALKHCLQRSPAGVRRLAPRDSGASTSLPLKSHAKYLGAVMTYRNFEDLTWEHRRKAAWIAFSRLRPWLKNKRISIKARLQLWQSSIIEYLQHFDLRHFLHQSQHQDPPGPSKRGLSNDSIYYRGSCIP